MSSGYSISDPMNPMDPSDPSSPIGSTKCPGSSPDFGPAAGRPTVLIVDDAPMNRKLLRLFLESAEFNVLDAADGVEALGILESHLGSIDVIISDILMPNMDGYQLCNRIRKHPKFNQLPFILYSSTFESPNNDQLCLAVGANRFLAKPAPPEEIVRALREVMTKPEQPAANWVPANDTAVLKEYNQALVRKLEQKNHELNEMIAHLNQAKLDLHTHNLELEGRVRERTEELIALNQKVTLLNATLEERVLDSSMIRLVWTNLLTNAVKFTAHQPAASIEVGALAEDGFHCFFVKDNGAGFDPRYKHKLFCVVQRLHSEEEFEETSFGLALVHRIITRHGGSVRAEGKPGHGATFFFTLPAEALSNAMPSLPLFSAISNEP